MAQERKSRAWAIYAEHYESDAEFRGAVEQALVDIFPLGFYSGRGVIVAPLRVQDDEGGYATIGFAFEEVFMPAVRRQAEEGPEEALADVVAAAAPEPEPVEA